MGNRSVKNITIAFFLNLSFTLIEIVGGILTNSVAIISDALHDLGDSVSLGLAWILEKLSSKKRTDKFSYGYRRLSLLGACVNALILLGGSLYILAQAIPRILNPQESHATGMLLLAILGIVVNGIAVLKTMRGKTMNEKVISWHLLEDVLGWAGILIASIVILFTDLFILDPILSVLITLYVLWGVVKNLRATTLLFLQATPKDLPVQFVEETIGKERAVQAVHDTHIWSLDGEHHILSAHIVVAQNSSPQSIVRIKQRVRERLGALNVAHATLEIEFENEQCAAIDSQQTGSAKKRNS